MSVILSVKQKILLYLQSFPNKERDHESWHKRDRQGWQVLLLRVTGSSVERYCFFHPSKSPLKSIRHLLSLTGSHKRHNKVREREIPHSTSQCKNLKLWILHRKHHDELALVQIHPETHYRFKAYKDTSEAPQLVQAPLQNTIPSSTAKKCEINNPGPALKPTQKPSIASAYWINLLRPPLQCCVGMEISESSETLEGGDNRLCPKKLQ